MHARWRYARILLIAAIPRLLYLLLAAPSFTGPYWNLSSGLLRDASLNFDGQPSTEFEPFYPVFLAAARVIVSHQVLLVQVLQIAVAATGAVFLHRLTHALTGSARAAAIAAVLYALDPLLIREAAVQTEGALFTTLLIGFASTFVGVPAWRRACLAGVWLGLAILTRSTALPLVALAPLVWIAEGRRRDALLLLSVAAILILPMPVRNHRVNGSLLPTRSGLNLFIGNSTYSSALLPDHDLDILQIQASSVVHARLPGVDDLPPPVAERTIDRLLTAEAVAYMTEHPLQTLRQKALNVLYIFSPRLVPYRIATTDTRIVPQPTGPAIVEGTRARPPSEVIVYGVWSSLVLACAVVGVFVRRRRLRADAILGCVVLTFVAVNAVYVPATRYRAPMEFALVFYAAVALAREPLEPFSRT